LYAEALDEDYPVLYKTADGRPIVHTNPTVQIGPFAVESHKFTGNLLGRYEEKGSRVTVARFLHRLQLTSASAPNINGVYDSADGLLYTRTDNPAFSLKYEPTDDRFHFTTPRNVYISDQRAGDSSRPDETTFYPAFGDTFTPKNASYVQGKFVEDPPINIRFQMATDDPTASEPVAAAAYPSSNTFTLTPAGEEIPFFSKIKGTGTKNMVDVIVGNYTKTQTGYMKNPAAIPVQFTQSGDRFTAVVSLEGTFGKPYRVTYTFVPADDMTQLGVQWTEGGQLKDKTTQIKFSS
jgi:hypothetical protein